MNLIDHFPAWIFLFLHCYRPTDHSVDGFSKRHDAEIVVENAPTVKYGRRECEPVFGSCLESSQKGALRILHLKEEVVFSETVDRD